MLIQSKPCPGCFEVAEFSVTPEQFEAWQTGTHVQDAFPHLSLDDTERLITGICPKCWVEMLPPEDEEDYYVDPEEYEYEDEWGLSPNMLDPESGDFAYERDWYVD